MHAPRTRHDTGDQAVIHTHRHRLWRAIAPVVVVAVLGSIVIWNLADHGRAQEIEEADEVKVPPDELELYIRVYTALQDDHDLAIENAIQPYHISIENFRALEQRIQSDPRLVDRVREALLDHVRSRGIYARVVGTPTPTPTGERSGGTRSR